ncbi:Putative nicotinamide riboside kinase, P-loop containing nucleoside triphosphate hydrolase [Septoria linicola]|uniref:Nicotinamide riboside kinase, P-loop containing nucleoside triphosphate hydrolase n=1 Tax=Septoria linicola TaxID=215465 RepID=A0A9Q9ALJ2_9PEZI|nr:Putative nicotinamide riboside kinase, P-loop containing nucleoside triphosphate hydrolase [Septoria linicola]
MPPSRGPRGETKALLIGVSGVSSSGKTTLARILRDIFPRTFILHEDDFYKTDNDIPIHSTHKIQDWDCLDSIDLPAFKSTLKYILQNGASPPDFISKEDKNSIGSVAVDRELIKDLEWKAWKWSYADAPPICIIDGFLLYSEEMKDIRDLFDVKLFLRTDHATAKSRREARSGYVTIEGFWEDPPGYVDNIVWPNYVKDHKFLFQDGNVEGTLNEEVTNKLGIKAMPGSAQGDMTACLNWAYEVLEEALQEFTMPRDD